MEISQIDKKLFEVYGNHFDVISTSMIGKRRIIKIRCCKCGNFFEKRMDYILEGRGCKRCKEHSFQNEIIKKFKIVHDDKFDYSLVNYTTDKQKIKIKCKTCKHIFLQRPSAHLAGESCKTCNINRQKSSNEFFIKKAKEKYGTKYDYSEVEYLTNKNKVKIICNKHQYIFEQAPNSHLRGQGCPICNQSKGELIIKDYLIEHNIKFNKNHRFVECRYKNPLPFDFYLPQFNTCIEYDGIQHFKERHYDNNSENLEKRKLRDNIKNNFCHDKNINLIRISYLEKNIISKLNLYLDFS